MKKRNALEASISSVIFIAIGAAAVAALGAVLYDFSDSSIASFDADFEITNLFLTGDSPRLNYSTYIIFTVQNKSPYDITYLNWYIVDDDENIVRGNHTMPIQSEEHVSIKHFDNDYTFIDGYGYTLYVLATFEEDQAKQHQKRIVAGRNML